ncbi:MAG: YraN family protein [Acidobacteria bacterium]|nr:YraN family protein [Acidobacteriota bacterium]
MGHVPSGPFREEGQSDDLSRRQYRGTRTLRKTVGVRENSAKHRISVGEIGERFAAEFLVRRGASVLHRNLRVSGGEIDLVVKHRGVTIAVEVKTIVGRGDPLDRIDAHKRDVVYRSVAAAKVPIQRVDAIGVQLFPDRVAIRWVQHL